MRCGCGEGLRKTPVGMDQAARMREELSGMEGMELLRGSEGEMEMLTATLGIKILAPPPCDKFQSQLPAKPGLEMLGPCPFRPVQRKGCARLDSPGNASPPGAGQPVARWLSSHPVGGCLVVTKLKKPVLSASSGLEPRS